MVCSSVNRRRSLRLSKTLRRLQMQLDVTTELTAHSVSSPGPGTFSQLLFFGNQIPANFTQPFRVGTLTFLNGTIVNDACRKSNRFGERLYWRRSPDGSDPSGACHLDHDGRGSCTWIGLCPTQVIVVHDSDPRWTKGGGPRLAKTASREPTLFVRLQSRRQPRILHMEVDSSISNSVPGHFGRGPRGRGASLRWPL
jgi:hypothetical protein